VLKKTITYKTPFDEEETEDFYFHYSKGELAEMAFGAPGGDLMTQLRNLGDDDNAMIIRTFRDFVLGSVGRRDGNKFIKTDKFRSEFEHNGAYSELFMEIINNADKAAEFVNGVIPKDMMEEATKAGLVDLPQTKIGFNLGPADEEEDKRPAWLRENREPTPRELQLMDKEELQLAFRHRTGQSLGSTNDAA
jgi:hypothetical protein